MQRPGPFRRSLPRARRSAALDSRAAPSLHRTGSGSFIQLEFAHWLALTGALLLALSFSSAYVQRMPISSSTVYWALGIILGPRVLGWMELRIEPGSLWFER